MRRLLANLPKAALLLVAVPAFALLAYDVVALRPQLKNVEAILSAANPHDAAPPALIRQLIDANAGSPHAYATRLATARLYRGVSQSQMHLRNALWGLLLPLHLGQDRMYGLYATLAFNGHDSGLSGFAIREYGKELPQLLPLEAAHAVALTHAPTIYLKDHERWSGRAHAILARCGCAGATAPATPLEPQVLISMVKRDGARQTVSRVWRSEPDLRRILSGVGSADAAWLDAAMAIAPGTDAGASEELNEALAEALLVKPYAVLAKTGARSWPGGELCEFAWDSELPGGVADYIERLNAALATPSSQDESVLHDRCQRGIQISRLAVQAAHAPPEPLTCVFNDGCGCAIVVNGHTCGPGSANFFHTLRDGAPLVFALGEARVSADSTRAPTDSFSPDRGDSWIERYHYPGGNVQMRFVPARSTCPKPVDDNDGCEYFDVGVDIVISPDARSQMHFSGTGTCGC
jgi:hypothetical protein